MTMNINTPINLEEHEKLHSIILLMHSIKTNNIERVKHRMEHVDLDYKNSHFLQVASMHSHQEIFDLLYPLSNPQEALDDMKQNGFSELDMLMLKRRITMEHEQRVLQETVANGGIHRNKRKV